MRIDALALAAFGLTDSASLPLFQHFLILRAVWAMQPLHHLPTPPGVTALTEETAPVDNVSAVSLASDIVVAYVSNNPVPRSELAALISDVHAAIERLHAGGAPEPEAKPVPVVPIRKSVTDSHILCLEDGKPFKSLKRHIHTHHGLTPDEYRLRWNLPHDYPMVAPTYAAARSALAKRLGLGRKPVEAAKAPAEQKQVRARPARKKASGADEAAVAAAGKPARRRKAKA